MADSNTGKEMTVIGADTLDEYHRFVETDKALERRFHPILVREPSDLWKAPEDDRFSSPQLVADLARAGRQAWYFPDTDALLDSLLTHFKPGDTVLVMSNGSFDGLIPRLCQALTVRKE